MRLNTCSTSFTTRRLTTSVPVCARPSKPTYETETARSSAGPTGQPGCHDAPSSEPVTGATCAWKAGSAGILRGMIAHCAQVVHVQAAGTTATSALVSLTSCGRRVLGPWRAHVGRHGLSAHHREGDGTTPLGTFAIGPTAYGLAPDPGLALRYHRLTCGDWWDEDPASPTYDEFRHVRCGTRPPFRGASEALWRATVAYRLFAVIAYNPARIAGRGSGMFLHVDTGRATNGCVALPLPRLVRLLRLLRPGARIRI